MKKADTFIPYRLFLDMLAEAVRFSATILIFLIFQVLMINYAVDFVTPVCIIYRHFEPIRIEKSQRRLMVLLLSSDELK